MKISKLYEDDRPDYPGVRSDNLLVLTGYQSKGTDGPEARLSMIKKGDGIKFWIEPNPLHNVLGNRPFGNFSMSRQMKLRINQKGKDSKYIDVASLEYLRAAFKVGFARAIVKPEDDWWELTIRHSYVDTTGGQQVGSDIDDTNLGGYAESEVVMWLTNYDSTKSSKDQEGSKTLYLCVENTYSTFGGEEKPYDPDSRDEWKSINWCFPIDSDYFEDVGAFLGVKTNRMRVIQPKKEMPTLSAVYDNSITIKSADAYLQQFQPPQKKGRR